PEGEKQQSQKVRRRAGTRLQNLLISPVVLGVWPQKATVNPLNFDARRVQTDRFQTGIGWSQFNLVAAPEYSFQSSARAIDKRDHNLAITRVVATFNQRDVTVADVL